MCEQCSAQTKTYGPVIPGWRLVQATRDGTFMKAGDYGLVSHDDPSYFWPESLVPLKDPSFGMTDEEFDCMDENVSEAWDAFMDRCEALEPHFKSWPEDGYWLITEAKRAGYDRKVHGCRFLCWLSHQMALAIERNPTADEALATQLYDDMKREYNDGADDSSVVGEPADAGAEPHQPHSGGQDG